MVEDYIFECDGLLKPLRFNKRNELIELAYIQTDIVLYSYILDSLRVGHFATQTHALVA